MNKELHHSDILALETCVNFMKDLLPKLEKALPPQEQKYLITYKEIWQDEPFNTGWEKQ